MKTNTSKIKREPKKEKVTESKIKENVPVKEAKNGANSPYRQIIGKYFDYSMDFDYLDIVTACVERIDFDEYKESDDRYEYALEAVDNYLIYTADQWTVLESYVGSPSALTESSWDDAFNNLVTEVYEIADQIAGSENGEDSDDENVDESLNETKLVEKPVWDDRKRADISKELKRIDEIIHYYNRCFPENHINIDEIMKDYSESDYLQMIATLLCDEETGNPSKKYEEYLDEIIDSMIETGELDANKNYQLSDLIANGWVLTEEQWTKLRNDYYELMDDILPSIGGKGYEFEPGDSNDLIDGRFVDRHGRKLGNKKNESKSKDEKKPINESFKKSQKVFKEGLNKSSRKLKEAKDDLQSEVSKFLKKCIEEGKDLEGMRWYDLDGDFSLSVGWLPGYDPTDKTLIVDEDGYALCAEITECPNTYAYVDFESLMMPYNDETGDVYCTTMALDPNDDCDQLAKWYLDELNEIKSLLNNGELTIE